jgi:hypothetical protein
MIRNPIIELNQALRDYIKEEQPEKLPLKENVYYTLDNVKYNKEMNDSYEYHIVRSCACDGTLYFYWELMYEILEELTNMSSCFDKRTMPEITKIKAINYEIGDFKLESEYGNFGTKEKPWMRCRFIVSLPVKCSYILKKSEDDIPELKIIEIKKEEF